MVDPERGAAREEQRRAAVRVARLVEEGEPRVRRHALLVATAVRTAAMHRPRRRVAVGVARRLGRRGRDGAALRDDEQTYQFFVLFYNNDDWSVPSRCHSLGRRRDQKSHARATSKTARLERFEDRLVVVVDRVLGEEAQSLDKKVL